MRNWTRSYRRAATAFISILRQRKRWKSLIIHHSRWTKTLPDFVAIPLLCGNVKNKCACPANLTIVLVHNYDHEPILEKSLRYVGIEHYVLLKPKSGKWPSNTQKLIELKKYIDSDDCSTEYILYIDSDDAVLRGDPGKAIEYLREEGCDALFSATTGTLHFSYLPELKQWADELAHENGYEGLYLNSGVFVGKSAFLKDLLEEALTFVTDQDLTIAARKKLDREGTFAENLPEFPKGGGSDQMIIRFLHPRYHPRIKVDFKRRLALR